MQEYALLKSIRTLFPKVTMTCTEETFQIGNTRLVLTKSSSSHRKGDHGRITVVGGSKQYHGAPSFSASAALQVGVELISILTEPSAAIPIKARNPNFMVNPTLPSMSVLEDNFHRSRLAPHLYNNASDSRATAHLRFFTSTLDTPQLSVTRAYTGNKDPVLSQWVDGWIAQETQALLYALNLHHAAPTSTRASSAASLPSASTSAPSHPAGAVVLGPGLGRDPVTLASAAVAVQRLLRSGRGLVLDAEGLLVAARVFAERQEEGGEIGGTDSGNTTGNVENLSGNGYRKHVFDNVVLTPNANELKRLANNLHISAESPRSTDKSSLSPRKGQDAAVSPMAWQLTDSVLVFRGFPASVAANAASEERAEGGESGGNGGGGGAASPAAVPEELQRLSVAMAVARRTGCVVFSKGAVDVATDGAVSVMVGMRGSGKRPGGLGDLTAGLCGVFLDWTRDSEQISHFTEAIRKKLPSPEKSEDSFPTLSSGLLASLSASVLCRHGAHVAYGSAGSWTTADTVLEHIGAEMKRMEVEELEQEKVGV